MKYDATTGKIEWTAEEKARLREIREHFRDRPTINELIARGEIDPDRIMTAGAADALLRALVTLKSERERRGLSLAEVASASGIASDVLERLEGGYNPNPTFEILSRYAAALGLDVHLDIRERDPSPSAEQTTQSRPASTR